MAWVIASTLNTWELSCGREAWRFRAFEVRASALPRHWTGPTSRTVSRKCTSLSSSDAVTMPAAGSCLEPIRRISQMFIKSRRQQHNSNRNHMQTDTLHDKHL